MTTLAAAAIKQTFDGVMLCGHVELEKRLGKMFANPRHAAIPPGWTIHQYLSLYGCVATMRGWDANTSDETKLADIGDVLAQIAPKITRPAARHIIATGELINAIAQVA